MNVIPLALIILLILAGFGMLTYQIYKIGTQINGRMTEMIASVKRLAYDEGVTKGIESERSKLNKP